MGGLRYPNIMGKRLIPPDKGQVEEVALRGALEERYLAYALSTIMNRALPDARDGLKPVHRRILYGMQILRLDPKSAFKKSAKVVGDVMGNFHPHGDQAVVLPAAFPNLLANGAQGIAVGMATSIPPHNAAELCDAALFLIDNPKARSRTLLKYVKGPDFPTGGVIIDKPAEIAEAYSTGRGSFRVRARWKTEDTGRGTYVIVITQIPWLVQKSRLVEKLAELINEKKLPLVADVRDESAEDVRLVIEPRARTVDAELMMESLFKLTELENRIPLNMNVLVKGRIPQVLGLAEVLREWLDHRRDVLVRRSKHRLAEIEHRLEVLGGYLIAYLNLDRVIKIIRREDEPKPVLMKAFKLSDVQADAILNMRLRNLRRLEEMEIRAEEKALREERSKTKALIASTPQQWKTIAGQIKELKTTFGPKTDLGKRRTTFAEAPEHDEAAIEEAMVVREPITVVVSDKGWIRTLRGHVSDLSGVTFKSDDALKFAFPTETTAKVLIFGSNGRFYTLDAAKLPGGRGHGEPVRMYFDLEQDADVVAALAYQGGRKFLVASYLGNGFVVPEDEVLGTTRKGKQVLNLKGPDKAAAMTTVDGELVAAIGGNRKMVIFALDQVPEMTRGRGVRLQRYKEKGLSDVTTFKADDGLSWIDGAGRTQTLSMKELKDAECSLLF